MPDSSLSIQDFETVNHLYASILCFKDRILTMVERVESVMGAMSARKELSRRASLEDFDKVAREA